MIFSNASRRLLIVLALGLWPAAASAGPQGAQGPAVVASVLPVHSLVAGVMTGRGAPTLLIRAGASPHGYSLRPSDARALAGADLVVWVGPGLEAFLDKPLRALGRDARMLRLDAVPSMILHPVRAGGVWARGDDHGEAADAEDAEGADAAGPGGPAHARINPHVWLDPTNAVRIVRAAAAALAEVDPAGGPVYRANAARLSARLEALDRELAARLAPARAAPYLVFHDAYRYFEAHYGLNAVGAFTVNPAVMPGARRLIELRARIAASESVCVFTEPQFTPAVVETVVAGTGARTGVLDPLGADLAPGPEAYFALMRRLVENFLACVASG